MPIYWMNSIFMVVMLLFMVLMLYYYMELSLALKLYNFNAMSFYMFKW